MGIQNKDGALYFATGIDNTGLYKSRREAIGIIKAMADEITSFDVFGGIGISAGSLCSCGQRIIQILKNVFRKPCLKLLLFLKR